MFLELFSLIQFALCIEEAQIPIVFVWNEKSSAHNEMINSLLKYTAHPSNKATKVNQVLIEIDSKCIIHDVSENSRRRHKTKLVKVGCHCR